MGEPLVLGQSISRSRNWSAKAFAPPVAFLAGLACVLVWNGEREQSWSVQDDSIDMAVRSARTLQPMQAGKFMQPTRSSVVARASNPDAPIKLGINGFGRIGRQVARIAMDRKDFVVKHINSPMSPEYMK